MIRPRSLAAALALVVCAAGTVGWRLSAAPSAPAGTPALPERGSTTAARTVASSPPNVWQSGIEPPPGLRPAIHLTDARGVTLGERLSSGRPVLMTFVFSGCGSTCPVSVEVGRRLLANDDLARSIDVAFANLDPISDDPASFARWLRDFDQRFVPLSSDLTGVSEALGQMGVSLEGTPGNYAHSAVWYWIERPGHIERVFPFATPADELAESLGERVSRRLGSS